MARDPGALLRRITGSTPVRQAAILVAVFTLVTLVTLGLAYLGLRASTEAAMRTNLDQHMAGFRVAASPAAVEILVSAEAEVADPAERVFTYIAPDGRVTGNADAVLSGGGIEIRRMPEGRPLGPDGYLPLAEDMAGGILILGESRTPLVDLRRTFLALLFFSLAPTIAISLGSAAWIARASHARVKRIEATLSRLTQGALDARIPEESGRSDDLARIGAEINRMAAAQEASTEALRQVSADIAHDLKTPLQRITALLHEMQSALPPDSPAAALAVRTLSEAEGAAGVFEGLLQIAQIEGGGGAAAMAPVDLSALAAGIADLYAPAAEDSGRPVTLDLDPALPPVSGNRSLLGQALSNLLENALRHTPEGTAVTLRTGREGASVFLEVADTGPGIPAPERDKVLRRLYRLERSRSTPGSGLGLALVAATARLHGAELTLDDAAPGLTVRLTFPAA